MPFIVGLSGGIGSGKSTAAAMLETLGAAVVDTDAIAHSLTAPGGHAMPAIAETFGEDYVRSDGSLDRDRMRATVFADPQCRKRLEGLLHPLIRREALDVANAAIAPYVVLVVPLLVETGSFLTAVQRIVIVDCEPELQISRAMTRSALTREAVIAITRTQVDRRTRLAAADDVLDNNGGEAALRGQVERLHQVYLRLAAEWQVR